MTATAAMVLWALAQEHPGKPAEHPGKPAEHPGQPPAKITAETIRKGISSYIEKDTNLKGGYFLIWDAKVNRARVLQLVKEAQEGAIGLTDEEGNLVGLLAGVSEDDLDELLVQTESFQSMIARSQASLQSGVPISAKDLLAEAQAELEEGKES